MAYVCPVCAYPHLPEPPENFSICPSCGTEFGFDDAVRTHTELRKQWIAAGAPWFSNYRPSPQGWSPWVQLVVAGMESPHVFSSSSSGSSEQSEDRKPVVGTERKFQVTVSAA